jgi:hypothetical protein
MRLNEHTVLLGRQVVLVPYDEKHVPVRLSVSFVSRFSYWHDSGITNGWKAKS